MREQLTVACLPADRDRATLVGRVWVPYVGPTVVCVRGGDVCDLSSLAPTMSQLLERQDAVTTVRNAEQLPKITTVDAALHHSYCGEPEDAAPRLIAPCDLQAIKASGGLLFPACSKGSSRSRHVETLRGPR